MLIRFIFLVLLIFHFATAQEKDKPAQKVRTAQELVAILDKTFETGDALIKGNLTLIKRSGETLVWKVNLFKKGQDQLYLLERGSRGIEYKILFKDDGDKAYLYNVLTTKLFQKNEEEKYENHSSTGFSYLDLSGYSYQANYNPIIQGKMEISGRNFIRLSLKPILSFSYKKLVLLMDEITLRPERIDFYDKDGVLFKTLNFKYNTIKLKQKKTVTDFEYANRMEMLDLGTGSISVLEFSEVDKDVLSDPSLFLTENLSR